MKTPEELEKEIDDLRGWELAPWFITNPTRTCELIAEYLRKESK